MKRIVPILLLVFVGQAQAQTCDSWGKQGKLLHRDDFSSAMQRWQPEYARDGKSAVTVKGGKLVMDVAGGATAWFKPQLEGDVLITFTRKVVMDGGRNDRLSDFNMFWMASDTKQHELFTRQGEFSEYDGLSLYYAGIGGNTNTTSRFRRYDGNGERVLLADLSDKAYLLQPNRQYAVQIAVYQGCTRVLVDGKEFFNFRDPSPLRKGHFGFRTTQSRHEMDDFKVYQLN